MPDKILVIQTAFLGDLFLSIPLLKAIKITYPTSKLALLCRVGFKNFFLKYNIVDECFEVDKKDKESIARGFKSIKNFRPDLVISPHQSFRTALWVKELGAKDSVGFYKLWNFWAFKKRIKRNPGLHDVERQLSLLIPLGIDVKSFSMDVKYPRILPHGSARFSNLQHAIALAPGSQWKTKRWTIEGYIQCCGEYLKRGKTVVLVGAPDETEIGRIIAEKYPAVLNYIGTTSIDELSQLLHKCELLISNDSGAMHVASLVGTPVVSVFGPTVPAQGYAPWNSKSVIVDVPLPCRPCGAHGHDECPIGTHDCMKKVSAESVIAAADRLLK